MQDARCGRRRDSPLGRVCYCPTPLEEERPYWEEFFELVKVQDATRGANCRDENGGRAVGVRECDCTAG